MKRIEILLKDNECISIKRIFVLKMFFRGVIVCKKIISKDFLCKESTLYMVGSNETYSLVRAAGCDALVLIKDESELDKYENAKYFVMNPEETEYTYFDRVYRRINDLPWEMINTKRLLLRETTEADVDDFVEIYKDPRMTEYMEDLYSDVEEERKYAREYRDKVYATQGFGIWTVVRKEDGRIIGRAGLTSREGYDEYEIGFAIGCEYQRKGYATEAIEAILSFAKEEELGSINALIMPGNMASKNLVAKIGFKKTEETTLDGKLYEVWKYVYNSDNSAMLY